MDTLSTIASVKTTPDTAAKQFVALLEAEACAIAQAASALVPEQIENAIALLYRCKGKVIVLGMGKSGIVGRKIAATLTSTGTVAVYLHPSDALHGDLGLVGPEDVAIALSNSGYTEEIIGLLPYLEHRKTPIIAIVGNEASPLAQKASVVLKATVDKEVCPLNLAPTASTTVAMAIGDAIAMTLMQQKGLTPEDFAFNHPSGRLGKRLTLKVSDLMHTPTPTVQANAPLIAVITAISQGGLGAVGVVNCDRTLLGIITDGDLRRTFEKTDQANWSKVLSQEIMTPNPVTVTADSLAYDALRTMEDRPSQISVLPVIDEKRLCIGIVRLHDVVSSGL
ncbi:MAG: arabinose-5-phosphate isomerase [Phormidesmis priestleyi Ana]|uniref:Arabinose-5-phosphate isomerase n=1 Tax=Phormidesmis priestleyi Ana TaxID=1666911 RepID=A0A0N8KNU4_9CYAN|nr:MAG: arabinose-5-phosphate isomerase [Phormidesmis priestleyi Ana]